MREETYNHYQQLIQSLDQAERLGAYLRWMLEHVQDEDEIYYDVLDTLNRYRYPDEFLLQWESKLAQMVAKYPELPTGIPASYFNEIGTRFKVTDICVEDKP